MSWLATKLISAFLLPPLNLLIVAGLGIVLLNNRPRLGRNLIMTAWLLLYLLCTPLISRALLQSLESVPPLQSSVYSDKVGAIVVLAAGAYNNAPEYGSDSATPYALERVRYAARLYRATGKPILLTGGNPHSSTAESMVMKDALENDFFVPVQWVEDQSENTWQNARLSYTILQPQGITTIYLVTHAWHMVPRHHRVREGGLPGHPRAHHVHYKLSFDRTGFSASRPRVGDELHRHARVDRPVVVSVRVGALHERAIELPDSARAHGVRPDKVPGRPGGAATGWRNAA